MREAYTWGGIVVVVLASVVGDVLLARAMKQVGDVHELWSRSGFWAVVSRTLGNATFFLGVTAMAVAFFSLPFALSWGDVSLVAPAAASAQGDYGGYYGGGGYHDGYRDWRPQRQGQHRR